MWVPCVFKLVMPGQPELAVVSLIDFRVYDGCEETPVSVRAATQESLERWDDYMGCI